MQIQASDFDKLLSHLDKERRAGNEFVIFLHDQVSGLGTFQCYKSGYEAAEACFESTTDRDRYSYLPIDAVFKTMKYAALNKDFLIENEGLTDLSAMVQANYQRLDLKEKNKQLNENFMDPKNVKALSETLMYTGFRTDMTRQLEKNLKKGVDTFEILFNSDYKGNNLTAVLHFKKHEKEGNTWYFFNRYDMAIRNENSTKTHTFYVSGPEIAKVQVNGKDQEVWINSTITKTQAYNLLEGRAVLKNYRNINDEKYTSWTKLDFKTKDEKGRYKTLKFKNYDLLPVLKEYPIRELESPTKRDLLLKSLERGDLSEVTIALPDGSERKMYVQAYPEKGLVNLYDEKMNIVINTDLNQMLDEARPVEITAKVVTAKKENQIEPVKVPEKLDLQLPTATETFASELPPMATTTQEPLQKELPVDDMKPTAITQENSAAEVQKSELPFPETPSGNKTGQTVEQALAEKPEQTPAKKTEPAKQSPEKKTEKLSRPKTQRVHKTTQGARASKPRVKHA